MEEREDEGQYYSKDQEGGKERKAQRGRFGLPEEERRINREETEEPERDGDQIWRAGDKRSDKSMEEEKGEEGSEGGQSCVCMHLIPWPVCLLTYVIS